MNRLAVLALLVVLAGCVGAGRGYSSSTDSGAPIGSDRESCVRDCNADYARCGDTEAAHRDASPNLPSDMFGASADCNDELKSCLPRCKGL